MPSKTKPTRVTSLDDIKLLGTILSVWAHPDDESFFSAGIMSAAAANGQTVVCVTATKGEKGVQNPDKWPAKKLATIRAKEMAQAMHTLGIPNHHWLNYPDGGCSQVNANEAVDRLKQLIEQYRPQTILTFGPEGMTGHPDHCTVSKWVDKATHGSDIAVYHAVELAELYAFMQEANRRFNFFFNIDKPPICDKNDCNIMLELPEKLLDKKYRALDAMPSQYEAMFNAFGKDSICKMIASEAFVKA